MLLPVVLHPRCNLAAPVPVDGSSIIVGLVPVSGFERFDVRRSRLVHHAKLFEKIRARQCQHMTVYKN